MLLLFCFQLVRLAIAALRRQAESPSGNLDPLPRVTVQLPMRDEAHVAERIIELACALDYPRDRLEIQVLDDSAPPTQALVRRRVEQLAAAGHPIQLVTRPEPTGYKAGALNAGLEQARGEFIVLFDADCQPQPDFLRANLPFFADPRVGLVQVRWAFENRSSSLLSRLQALVLDALFAVDQYVRSRQGKPVQFNGSNGIWRRQCLDDVGSWNERVLTEDAEIAFRAYLNGWAVTHRRDYAVPTEVPRSIGVFRVQQRRWARGSAQTLRHLLGRIVQAAVPLPAKLAMLMHLGRHSVYPLVLLTFLSSPLTTLHGMPHLINYGVPANSTLVGLIMGTSLIYTVAFLHGLVTSGGAFVRTPKLGDAPGSSGPRYRASRDPLVLLEIAFGLAHGYAAYSAFLRGVDAYAAFFCAVALSFLWVGLGSLRVRAS
jgi:cellulose synthase/poly-beta-1,6-N-acetylglucosamine synthase-like glycosyltransferase